MMPAESCRLSVASGFLIGGDLQTIRHYLRMTRRFPDAGEEVLIDLPTATACWPPFIRRQAPGQRDA
ncbi:MAG: hypothetical protein CM15mP115_18220 [Alphaproteobacteria bacterium]|nr:MAG: hypothetical protein CM15mP115_18220 [Alphaproteobacteria bacterium]